MTLTDAAPASAPAWFIAARKEIGVRERPENRGPDIRRYIALAHCGTEGDPWCAIFANAMLESVGMRGTRSALARSFERDSNFVKLAGPALGCIVTFWRGEKSRGLGHVGFYNGERAGFISTLGGNEGDMVQVENMRVSGSTFGLSGFYWPKSVPLPIIGKLPVQSASAAGTGKVT
jgi:uncharacterized protein (TIGR02594 family)